MGSSPALKNFRNEYISRFFVFENALYCINLCERTLLCTKYGGTDEKGCRNVTFKEEIILAL